MATGQVLFHRFFYSKSFVKHNFEVSLINVRRINRRKVLRVGVSLAQRLRNVAVPFVAAMLPIRSTYLGVEQVTRRGGG